MTVETVTAILLIVVPIAFNVAFFELGRAFDYPDILRKEPDEILRRFAAGGSGLILRWEALLVSALAMLPLAALLAVVLGASPALSALRSSSARPRHSSRGWASSAGRSPCRSWPAATWRRRRDRTATPRGRRSRSSSRRSTDCSASGSASTSATC